MIQNVGKGALPDSLDERDLRAEPVLGAIPIDWTKQFLLPNPGDEDQGQSESCVAQAWSYYHTQIHAANYSRRDLYSRIFQPAGGASIRDGGKEIVNNGQDTRDHMPDPTPETEMGMRDASGRNTAGEAAHKELNYAVVASPTPDAIAAALQAFKGAVFGVTGSDPAWKDMLNPVPPSPGEATWGHALYAMGYHTHSDGQKCIIAKSSWCNYVREHHIRENYFFTGNTFNAWTLIPAPQKIKMRKIGWNDTEKGRYVGFDTMDRQAKFDAAMATLFSDYELDSTEYNLGNRPWG